jgi:hypothetical protein
MIRIGKAFPGSISSMVLVIGMSGVACSQTTPRPPEPSTAEMTRSSDTNTSDAKKSAAPFVASKATTQEEQREQIDREKVTLKDRVEESIAAAEAHTDALKKMNDNATPVAKKRNDDMQKRLSDLRERLHDDLDRIDKASTSDWKEDVRGFVQRDLSAMNAELRAAQNITRTQPSQKGAASKQPENTQPTKQQHDVRPSQPSDEYWQPLPGAP